jgi:hypothetical protein
MTRFAAALLGLAVAAGTGFAQPQPNVAPRPTFSPYLNLLRGGGGAGINYFGLVRPEIQLRQQANTLQQQLNATNQNLSNLENQLLQPGEQPGLAGTGHGVVFNQPFRYFNTLPGGGGGARGTGGGGSPARPATSAFGSGGGLYAGAAVRTGGGGGMTRPGGGTAPNTRPR